MKLWAASSWHLRHGKHYKQCEQSEEKIMPRPAKKGHQCSKVAALSFKHWFIRLCAQTIRNPFLASQLVQLGTNYSQLRSAIKMWAHDQKLKKKKRKEEGRIVNQKEQIQSMLPLHSGRQPVKLARELAGGHPGTRVPGLSAKRGRPFARHCTLLVAAAKSDECVKCKLCYGEITAPKAERQLQRKARKKLDKKAAKARPKTGKVT